jgi:hypothetical protein
MNIPKILSYGTFELIVSMVLWAFTGFMVIVALQSCQTRTIGSTSATTTDIGTVVSVSSSHGGSRIWAAMLIKTTTGYYPVRGQRVFALHEALVLLTFDNGERQICNVAKDQCMELLLQLD